MRNRWKRLSTAGRLAVTIAAIAVLAGIVLGIRSTGVVTSEGGGGGPADPSHITYVPVRRITPVVPDYSGTQKPSGPLAGCLYPADERPDPNLPPLSCRNARLEPSAGTIPTIDPAKRPTPPSVPAATRLIDNQAFRFTVQVPDSWFSNMRPEGGEFCVYDPIATQSIATGAPSSSSGVAICFSARKAVTDGAQIGVEAESELAHLNAMFGESAGAIWDQGSEEGDRVIVAAFSVGDVIFQAEASVLESGQTDASVQAAVDSAKTVFATIVPY